MEHQLQEEYHEQRAGEEGRSHPLDERRDQIDAWRQEGYSFVVIHELLRQRGVKCSETTVRRYIHRHFLSPVRPVMRCETKPVGAEWSDAWNGDRVPAGGTTVAAAAPTKRIPAFIRGHDRDLATLFQGLYER